MTMYNCIGGLADGFSFRYTAPNNLAGRSPLWFRFAENHELGGDEDSGYRVQDLSSMTNISKDWMKYELLNDNEYVTMGIDTDVSNNYLITENQM